MAGRLAHWLRAPLSPVTRATVVALALTFLVVAIVEQQWGHVAEIFYAAIAAVLVMRFVCLPLATRHAEKYR